MSATLDLLASQIVDLLPALSLLLLAGLLLWTARSQGRDKGRTSASAGSLARQTGAAIAAGGRLVMPLGRGSVAGSQSADSVAALAIARQAQPTPGAPCDLVAGDSTLWLAARQAGLEAGFVGPDSATFAAGVRERLAVAQTAVDAPCGVFGDDFLLFAEPMAWRGGVRAPAAATTPTVLPFLLINSDRPLVGDELFGMATALEGGPGRVPASLTDRARLVLAVVILAAALLRALQALA